MTREEVSQVVRNHLIAVVESAQGLTAEQIDEKQSIEELGADSLEVVELVSRSMKELRVKVRRSEIGGAETLSEIVDRLTAAVQEGQRRA